jgi:cation:H+ antiporter
VGLGEFGTGVSVAVLLGAALVLVTVGVRFTRLVDELADRTGMGEAIAGALLLGATTSLPGLVTTVLGALEGEAGFAVSNAVGGIAAQTAFLAFADLTYRRVNLEHAAVSVANMVQSMVLVTLVGIVLAATGSPEVTVLGVHPATLLVLGTYAYGLALVRSASTAPMWRPEHTDETVRDEPDPEHSGRPMSRMWTEFAAGAVVIGGTGWAVGTAGLALAESTGLSGSLVGGLFTSVITSLPELVTVIAAVRIGAPQLAVGDIVGGNTFDVLFVAAADVAYTEGSVYHAADQSALFLLSLTVIMVAALAAGMLVRDRRAIGFEGWAILGSYGVGIIALVSLG